MRWRVRIPAHRPADDDGPAAEPLTFSWRLQGLQLDLGTLLDHLHDRPVWAGVAARDETLASPCLLCGDNGQGKSLIAKALASAMPYTGEATVYGPNGPRRVRLLFQDVLNQTLMRSMRQLTFRGNAKDVAVAYDDILDGIRRRVPDGPVAHCYPLPIDVASIRGSACSK